MKLKTRTNQPVYYKLPVSSNIQSLSDDLLNSLRVGDVVQKKTGNQKHCYIVTYKEEKHGICLSYFDGSGYIETISYDYNDGHWVYNSKDVFEGAGKSYVDTELAKKANLSGANFSGPITSPSIIEDMSGYSFTKQTGEGSDVLAYNYVGVVKNGNKITFVIFANLTLAEGKIGYQDLGSFVIPQDVADKIIPYSSNVLDMSYITCIVGTTFTDALSQGVKVTKPGSQTIKFELARHQMVASSTYTFRIEKTFLLSNNLASN